MDCQKRKEYKILHLLASIWWEAKCYTRLPEDVKHLIGRHLRQGTYKPDNLNFEHSIPAS